MSTRIQETTKHDPGKGQGKPPVPAPGKNPDFPGTSDPVDPPPTSPQGGNGG